MAAMVRVAFTANLQRHLAAPAQLVAASTVRAALDAVFAGNERLRGYILDEHGAVRKHVAIFVNGEPLRDRERLSDPVADGAEIFVMQALSGGSCSRTL